MWMCDGEKAGWSSCVQCNQDFDSDSNKIKVCSWPAQLPWNFGPGVRNEFQVALQETI